MDDWQTKIGQLVRQTYKEQGYNDILIMIGGTTSIDEKEYTYTQIWYPDNTASDFDLRFMVFAILNHFFSDFNEIN